MQQFKVLMGIDFGMVEPQSRRQGNASSLRETTNSLLESHDGTAYRGFLNNIILPEIP
jgi:hypothetical protein